MRYAGGCGFIIVAMSFLCGCATGPQEQIDPPGAAQYLAQIRRDIGASRLQMPAITQSAEKVAARYVRGARIFAAGSQEEFAREMIDRNGGLAEIGLPPARIDLVRRGDVILFGARSQLTMNDRLRIARWREAGAHVIGFASRAQDDPFFLPDDLIDSGDEAGLILLDGKTCPTDGAMNMTNAWTWTGEFIAACSRLSRAPPIGTSMRVAYHSGGERIAAGELGTQYLDAVERAVAQLQRDAVGLSVAGAWVRDCDPAARRMFVISRLFPEHFTDARAPQPFADVRVYQKGRMEPGCLTLVLAAQSAPQLAIDAAHLRRARLVYSSAEQARDDRADYLLYVSPNGPADDGAIAITGYNRPALPIGTVMQSIVYWAIVAEAQQPPPAQK